MTDSTDKDYLRRSEFFTALKAIAICQNYEGLHNYESYIDSANVPLPDFTSSS